MTLIVAAVLSLMVSGLREIHTLNESVYNKKGILSAVATQLGKDVNSLTSAEVQTIFETQITQKALNSKGEELTPEQIKSMTGASSVVDIDLGKENKKPADQRVFPLFVFKSSDSKTYNILYARGKGLWDEIWGYITLDNDLNTIAGQAFDHKGETPGLGAEIKDNKAWYTQFTGKKLYNEAGEYKSVAVVKGGVKNKNHEVDAISGATITGNGVDDMLDKGLAYYEPYLKKNKK